MASHFVSRHLIAGDFDSFALKKYGRVATLEGINATIAEYQVIGDSSIEFFCLKALGLNIFVGGFKRAYKRRGLYPRGSITGRLAFNLGAHKLRVLSAALYHIWLSRLLFFTLEKNCLITYKNASR